jgi:hypothetical protein
MVVYKRMNATLLYENSHPNAAHKAIQSQTSFTGAVLSMHHAAWTSG